MLQIGKYGKIKIAIWSHCPWLQTVVAVVAAAIGSEACLSQNHIYFFSFLLSTTVYQCIRCLSIFHVKIHYLLSPSCCAIEGSLNKESTVRHYQQLPMANATLV